MKRIAIAIVAVLTTACVIAQEKPRRGNGGGRHRGERQAQGERQAHHGERQFAGPMMHGMGAWVPRMLSNKMILEKIGITDTTVCTKIIDAVKPLKDEGDRLEQKIRDLSRENAQLMRELLKNKNSDPMTVMDKVDELAKLRAKQGRLSVKALVVLRDNLSVEQVEKAREFIFERGRERGKMRRGGIGPDGERPSPPPDGSAPREMPYSDNQD